MKDETPHDELVRLRKAQLRALQNEVYGGMSHTEKAEYDSRAERIHDLEKQFVPTADGLEDRD
jgi:hypothetical protein